MSVSIALIVASVIVIVITSTAKEITIATIRCHEQQHWVAREDSSKSYVDDGGGEVDTSDNGGDSDEDDDDGDDANGGDGDGDGGARLVTDNGGLTKSLFEQTRSDHCKHYVIA